MLILSYRVTEFSSDNANLSNKDKSTTLPLFRRLKLLAVTSEPRGKASSTHNHPFELKMAARQSFKTPTRVTEFSPDNATSVEQKQVNDIVFILKTQATSCYQ